MSHVTQPKLEIDFNSSFAFAIQYFMSNLVHHRRFLHSTINRQICEYGADTYEEESNNGHGKQTYQKNYEVLLTGNFFY